MTNRNNNTSIPIDASDILKRYLKETLDLEKAKAAASEPGNKLSETDQRKRGPNSKKKVRILKRLFTSIADLIYFFEFLDLYPQLMNTFEEDLQDLLGLKGAGPRNPKGEGFIRLLSAILSESSHDDEIEFNYRRRMVKVMQFLINQKAKFIVMTAKKDPLRYDDLQFRDMIFHDLDRAQVWMNYLDRLTTFETAKPNRVIVVSIEDLG